MIKLPTSIDWPQAPCLLSTENWARLKKALYGLKQSPRLWWIDISKFLLEIGFTQSTSDTSLYTMPGMPIFL